MKSLDKNESVNLVFKWDKNADRNLNNFPDKMSFEDYLHFLEQFNPTEKELRKVKIFKTKFSL